MLRYFVDETMCVAKGEIALHHAELLNATTCHEALGIGNCFAIQTPQRTYYMQENATAVRQMWMQQLERCLSSPLQ